MTTVARCAVIFLFVFSGMTSLILQTLWIRILSLGVGSTSAAIGMVLAIFFLGLALGSYLGGRVAHRLRRPVLIYGALEGIVGIYSLVLLFPLLNFHYLIGWMPLIGDYSWLGTFGKFLLVAVLLLPASIGMGASLPLLVRALIHNDDAIGKNISLLYAINTLGAVLGAFTAAFVFLPRFGVINTNIIVSCISLILFAIAAWLTKKYARQGIILEPVTNKAATSSFFDLTRTQHVILGVCGVTGFSSIAAEVVWNKYLGIYFGTNIYGLGLILSIFLAGIALGSFLLSIFIERIKNHASVFLMLLVAATFGLVITSHLLNLAPLAANVTAYYLGDAVTLLTIKSIIAGLVMLPTTVMFGALFPLAVRMITVTSDSAPRLVGLAFAVNTIGAIIGSYFGGLVLIPLIGSSKTISLSVLAMIIVTILVLWQVYRRTFGRVLTVALLVPLCFVVLTASQIDFRNIIKSAYFQAADERMGFSEVMKYFSHEYEEFILIVEGKSGVISLSHDQQDGEFYRDYYRLKTNGLNESIYNRLALDELPKYEGLLGLLPYLFSKDPHNAFVVGYGGGFTVDFLTGIGLEEVFVAELEQGVIDAAQFVYNGRNPIMLRPNLILQIEDARFLLATQSVGKFDVIVSQPSHSWLSGVANLFTKEFFEIVQKNLTEDGVFSQWLNLYNMNEEVLKSILGTFYSVFPHGAVFTDLNDQELIMIGSNNPIEIDYGRLYGMTESERLRQQLRLVPFDTPFEFLSNFSLSRDEVLQLTDGSVINTDINAYAEVRQSRLFYQSREDFVPPQTVLSDAFTGSFRSIVDHSLLEEATFFYNLLIAKHRLKKFDKYQVTLDSFSTGFAGRQEHQLDVGFLSLLAQRYSAAKEALSQNIVEFPSSDALDFYLALLSELSSYEQVLEVAEGYEELQTQLTRCYIAMARLELEGVDVVDDPVIDLLLHQGDLSSYELACGDFFPKLAARLFLLSGRYDDAIPYFADVYDKYPHDIEAVRGLVVSYLQTDRWPVAKEFSSYLPQAIEERQEQLRSLAQFYRDRGMEEDAVILEDLARRW